MNEIDETELWISDNEEEWDNEDEETTLNGDPTSFTLHLERQGHPGGYHVRNKPNQKQRHEVSGFGAGPKMKPAFSVSCVAKVIIHGTMSRDSTQLATLLIYDFSFLSYRSARIKNAEITFEFRPSKEVPDGGCPTVKRVGPYAKHVMMQTTQKETVTKGGELGISGGVFVNGEGKGTMERSVEKVTTHAAEIVGDNPFDEWGDRVVAKWSLKENQSQQNGIVTLLRTCILLARPTDTEFSCIPTVEAKPDFRTQLGSLFGSRRPDDPIILDPEYEPYNPDNLLDGGNPIDRWNLGKVDLENLWDCTFHKVFGEAVKVSKKAVPSSEPGKVAEQIETVAEVFAPSC